MFAFLTKKKPITAHINAQPIVVQPKETLLQAALREGINFPHSCRVGGCASCKCKLVNGKVKELTEAGYILSDEDLDQGYILACQSVPQTDVSIEVDLGSQQARRRVGGRVVSQDKLTHDITRLRVQLDEALAYKAGQFADISIESLSGVSRSYSFATPVQPDSQVSFFVRRVPGGVFSSAINDGNVVGQSVTIDGPAGDFWLRPSDAPILLVAGGSGLAPVLALLKDAVAHGVSRPVALLFGAREERDLYALDEIQEIARQWRGPFKFIPVLSAAAADASWRGERGLVIDKIPMVLAAGTHAYLCGPPPMIDSAVALLKLHGVPAEYIHADRFTTLQDAVAVAA
jgi:3-phenylpropionate/trans-cinnamate dioxygenase ferredoxin reductase subunit